MARKKNPEPITIIALFAAAGAAIYALVRGKKKQDAAKKKKAIGDGTTPSNGGTKPGKKPGKKPGTKPSTEPKPDGSPGGGTDGLTQLDMANLEFLGYPPVSTSVFKFQQDFNAVNQWLLDNGEPLMLNMTLKEDGDIGKDTRSALDAAMIATDTYAMSWKNLTITAKQSLAG